MVLVRETFGERLLAEEITWQSVVLITKGKGDYRGIGLVEVIWKVLAEILNQRLTSSITYHDFLHRFRAGCGTGTPTIKAKLLQQLAALREEVLYVIFLDLHNVYNALYRYICLEILEGYGVGPQACRFLRTYWGQMRMVAKAGGYYGSAFQGSGGRDTDIPAIPHYLQRGGGCGGASLGHSYGVERGRAEQVRTRGQTPKLTRLCG